MGLFTSLFGKTSQKERQEPIPWKPLTTEEQLDHIEKESQGKLVAIFKHSTRCAVSRMALRGFEREFDLQQEGVDIYLLDLLSFRDVSLEIAGRFGIHHESPQLILLKDGQAVANFSHHAISANSLKTYA